MRESGLRPPSFLKMDVEGAELNVLKGAVATIREHQPSIIFEYNTEMAGAAGWNLSSAFSLLSDLGNYSFYFIDRSGKLSAPPSGLDSLAAGYYDILAIHKKNLSAIDA